MNGGKKMTIKAYTFEAKGKSQQLAPHDAKTDARIRRDLFFGSGDFITVGDKNGNLQKQGTSVTGSKNSSFTFTFSDSVTFSAGGRLFSMGGTEVTIPVKPLKNNQHAAGYIYFDINTEEPSGEYVKQVAAPGFAFGEYESPTFSVKYLIIFIQTGRNFIPYAATENSGHFLAGGTIEISNQGKDMAGNAAPYRGQFAPKDDLFLTKKGKAFTLTGTLYTLNLDGNGNGSMVDISNGFYGIELDRTGSAVFYHQDFIATADIITGDDNNLFKLENVNLSAKDGTPKQGRYTRVFMIANFSGQLVTKFLN